MLLIISVSPAPQEVVEDVRDLLLDFRWLHWCPCCPLVKIAVNYNRNIFWASILIVLTFNYCIEIYKYLLPLEGQQKMQIGQPVQLVNV